MVAGVVVLVVLVLELLVAAVLLWQARKLRPRIAAVDAEVDGLEAAVDGEPAVMSDTPNPLISVEILNAHELAARESWAARRFGTLVPRIVGREVAARAAQQMSEQLVEQGVRAEVRIVRPRQS
jgi:hypothetical protein